ncbi:HD-GYP domain-containing protein [Paenibacillus sp. JX-17]|uniref:HD-GYP domain-containing protein n=1 Tax=Paenibacillus lacisoli TaxID=3064525 RepID=A0ABT9CGV0_9BACL|nr:HD-GYP domain-containing protein [Paenibacillus sp. JX-17]MDO7908482.1 HD-GYP domain-containing protein [Paenibacillus sp. JX-17]
MRIHVTDAKPGDILQSDTYNSFGLLILGKGTELKPDDLAKFLQHGIDYIDVDTGMESSSSGSDLDDDAFLIESYSRVKPLFLEAFDTFEAMFVEAAQTGVFDEYIVTAAMMPLTTELNNHRDVVSLLLLLDKRDEYTYKHSLQVGVLSYYIALWMGYSQEEAYVIGKAGYMHDIGKSMIPPAILNKPGKLTPDEYEEMKRHAQLGYDIILNSTNDEISALVALQHHEREDGKGYPHGLVKEQIHPYARIVAVADVYSAMSSNRVYQNKQELLSVLRELYQLSFGQLNAEVTQAFIRHMLPNFIGKRVLLTNGESGVIIHNNAIDYFRPLVQTERGFVDLASERSLAIDEIYM